MLKISVIVPAYNVADYITRCIESIAKQDMSPEEFEAIVVNDGSTDNTLNIVQKLTEIHAFVKIITSSNKGLSMARNRGIEEARGKYLVFLDSDDSMQPDVLSRIYDEMEKDYLDMMLMNYQRVDLQGKSSDIFFLPDKSPRHPVSGKTFLSTNSYPPMVWAYAYRKQFLKDNALSMLPIWHEDEEFTPRAIYLANRIKYFPVLYYNYFQNKESYMESYKEENFLYIIRAMGSLKRFIRQYPSDTEGRQYFDNHISGILMFYLKKNLKEGYKNQQAIVKEIKKEKLLPLYPRKKSFYTVLLNFSPSLFMAYYRLFRSHR